MARQVGGNFRVWSFTSSCTDRRRGLECPDSCVRKTRGVIRWASYRTSDHRPAGRYFALVGVMGGS